MFEDGVRNTEFVLHETIPSVNHMRKIIMIGTILKECHEMKLDITLCLICLNSHDFNKNSQKMYI